MSEKKLYQDFKKVWPSYIKRLELKNEVGIPDCHLVSGVGNDIFLELKYLAKEFKECVLPIKKTQFIWHYEYSGKNAFMLFQVESKYYLISKSNIFQLRGRIKWRDFYKLAEFKSNSIDEISNYLIDL